MIALAVAPITDLVFDLLGTDRAGGLLAIIGIAAIYLWSTRTGRHKDKD